MLLSFWLASEINYDKTQLLLTKKKIIRGQIASLSAKRYNIADQMLSF